MPRRGYGDGNLRVGRRPNRYRDLGRWDDGLRDRSHHVQGSRWRSRPESRNEERDTASQGQSSCPRSPRCCRGQRRSVGDVGYYQDCVRVEPCSLPAHQSVGARRSRSRSRTRRQDRSRPDPTGCGSAHRAIQRSHPAPCSCSIRRFRHSARRCSSIGSRPPWRRRLTVNGPSRIASDPGVALPIHHAPPAPDNLLPEFAAPDGPLQGGAVSFDSQQFFVAGDGSGVINAAITPGAYIGPLNGAPTETLDSRRTFLRSSAAAERPGAHPNRRSRRISRYRPRARS